MPCNISGLADAQDLASNASLVPDGKRCCRFTYFLKTAVDHHSGLCLPLPQSPLEKPCPSMASPAGLAAAQMVRPARLVQGVPLLNFLLTPPCLPAGALRVPVQAGMPKGGPFAAVASSPDMLDWHPCCTGCRTSGHGFVGLGAPPGAGERPR